AKGHDHDDRAEERVDERAPRAQVALQIGQRGGLRGRFCGSHRRKTARHTEDLAQARLQRRIAWLRIVRFPGFAHRFASSTLAVRMTSSVPRMLMANVMPSNTNPAYMRAPFSRSDDSGH